MVSLRAPLCQFFFVYVRLIAQLPYKRVFHRNTSEKTLVVLFGRISQKDAFIIVKTRKMKNVIITIFGICLLFACSIESIDTDLDHKDLLKTSSGDDSYAEEISETDINQMRSMMNSAWGWKSYSPRIINCWDPSAIRISVYDLNSFPQVSYDGTVTSLSSLQLSVILQGSCESYAQGWGEPMPEEAEIIWNSFCAAMEQTIEKQITALIEEGSFWEEYKELSSYLERRKSMSIIGNKIYESNYSLRILRAIRITSSSDLYGMTAGEDIGSHFMLSGTVNYVSHAWNSLDGQFKRIDKPLDGMSFEEFLEYRPFMRQLEIKLKDIPEENPENLTLTVFITYEDGDEVSASATIKIGSEPTS